MNLDIKQRIEQIENGEVPNGYIKKYKYVFPNTWNLVNLGSVTKRKSEKNKNRNDLKSYSINNQVGFIQQDEQFSEGSYQDVDKTNYKVVKPGEFAYNPARINIGSIGLQKEDADVIISSLYVCFGLDKSYSKTYFENWFKSYDFNKEITRNLEGSVREYLFYENFSNIKLPIPSLAEQQKIAEILMQCDKLIELKQKRIDEEKRKKQAMLKKVFVNNNSIEYSLCNLCTTIIDGDWIESKDQSEDGIRLIQTGNIGVGRYFEKEKAAKYISDETFKTLNCTEVFDGDVLVSRLPDPIGRACMIRNLKTRAITAVDCTIMRFKEQLQAELFLQYATTQEYFNKLQSLAGGSTRTRISRKELKKLKVKLPKEDKRARLINDLFKQQDRILITLEKELEQWQQKKKSLMQLLLTGIVRVKV